MEPRISVRVTEEELKAIDKLAEKETRQRRAGASRVSRSEMIRILLDESIKAKQTNKN